MHALAAVGRYGESEAATMDQPDHDNRTIPATARRPADALNPQRVLLSLRALFRSDDPADGHEAPSARGTGVEPPQPDDRIGEPIAVTRTFAFVDITGFTEYCDRHGDHAAIELLTRFRGLVRDVAARRGVRVAKWLGDGAMLVGVDEGPVVATVAELVMRSQTIGLDTHAGIASGTVLLFEGDDYVGRPANFAARLCDVAEPGEILAHSLLGELPGWVETRDSISVSVAGVGDVTDVRSVTVRDPIGDDLAGDGAAA
jgi:adenylate cyclase